jgi:hypothetical protein
MNCSWPTYRVPYKESFKYKCGLYQQSHGQSCDSNPVDGQVATKFILGCIRQKLLAPSRIEQIASHLRRMAQADRQRGDRPDRLASLRADLTAIDSEQQTINHNLARAQNQEQYDIIAAEWSSIQERRRHIERQLAELQSREHNDISEKVVQEVTTVVRQLAELANEVTALDAAGEIIRKVDAKLYLAFEPKQAKNRIVNKVKGGVGPWPVLSRPLRYTAGQQPVAP